MKNDNMENKTVKNKINEILSETYVCTRVWTAWGVGTMTEDDFLPISDTQLPEDIFNIVEELLDEIEELQADTKLFQALKNAGVDNWEGYEEVQNNME